MKHILAILLAAFVISSTVSLTANDNTTEKPHAPQSEPVRSADWPLFRGDAEGTGVARSQLPENLQLLWKFSAPKGGFESTAAIVGDAVYVGDTGGKFYVLNLSDGKKRWEFPSPLGFTASAAVKDGRVYIGDSDGLFFCLDAKSGEKLWTFQTEGEINSSANFYKNYVIFGSQDTMLYCLDAQTGKLAWKFEGGDQIRCFPTILDHYAFIAGCDGALSMIDLDNEGKLLGKVPIDSPTMCSAAALGGNVFVGTEGNVFLCVDTKEKNVLWRFEAEKHSAAYRSSAAVTKEAVLVGSRDKQLRAFDPATGKPLWSFATKNRVDSSPVIVGSRVFVGSADGRIYGLNLKTGEKIWQYEAGGAVVASPAVAKGRLVIGNNQGELFCFGEK